jgi:sec-independent protein translocase protein TatA
MGISIWQLLIVLAIVLVIFGAKRLRNLGGDLGAAVKNFRESVKDPDGESKDDAKLDHEERVIEGEATREKDKV